MKKSVRILTTSTAAAAVLLASTTAGFAKDTRTVAPAGKRLAAEKRLSGLDKNGDGSVTRDDIGKGKSSERAFARFERLDANHDGTIAAPELRAWAAQRPAAKPGNATRNAGSKTPKMATRTHRIGQRFTTADSNADGALSLSEFMTARGRFARLDKDGDGIVKMADLRQAPQALAKLQPADLNGDGMVTKVEMADRMSQSFRTLDANGDGLLAKQEMRARVREQSAAKRGSAPTAKVRAQ